MYQSLCLLDVKLVDTVIKIIATSTRGFCKKIVLPTTTLILPKATVLFIYFIFIYLHVYSFVVDDVIIT